MHRYIVFALLLAASSAAAESPVRGAVGSPDRELVSIQPKRNVFVLGAFLLATARESDADTRLEHPLRRLVRSELRRKLDAEYLENLRAFCERNRMMDSRSFCPEWIPAATTAASAPAGSPDTSTISGRIADFASRSDIDALWHTYREVIALESEEYLESAYDAIARITEYLGLDPAYVGTRLDKVRFQVNPLLDYESAQTKRMDRELFVIAGPTSKGPTESIFFHELLHFVLEPLTIRYAKDIERSSSLFELLTSNGAAPEPTWAKVVEESFVRSITAILSVRADGVSDFRTWNLIDAEYGNGYLLCPLIHFRLRAQEPGKGQSFEEWYRQTLAAIDLQREQLRFRSSRETTPL